MSANVLCTTSFCSFYIYDILEENEDPFNNFLEHQFPYIPTGWEPLASPVITGITQNVTHFLHPCLAGLNSAETSVLPACWACICWCPPRDGHSSSAHQSEPKAACGQDKKSGSAIYLLPNKIALADLRPVVLAAGTYRHHKLGAKPKSEFTALRKEYNQSCYIIHWQLPSSYAGFLVQ